MTVPDSRVNFPLLAIRDTDFPDTDIPLTVSVYVPFPDNPRLLFSDM